MLPSNPCNYLTPDPMKGGHGSQESARATEELGQQAPSGRVARLVVRFDPLVARDSHLLALESW